MGELMLVLAPFSLFLTWAGALVVGPVIKKKVMLAYHGHTKGVSAPDYNIMNMVITSLEEFPTEWKISAGDARFPKQGAYKIALDREKGKMTVSIAGDSSDGRFTQVSPYFEAQLNQMLDDTLSNTRKEIVQRTLFPDGMPLLLGNK